MSSEPQPVGEASKKRCSKSVESVFDTIEAVVGPLFDELDADVGNGNGNGNGNGTDITQLVNDTVRTISELPGEAQDEILSLVEGRLEVVPVKGEDGVLYKVETTPPCEAVSDCIRREALSVVGDPVDQRTPVCPFPLFSVSPEECEATGNPLLPPDLHRETVNLRLDEDMKAIEASRPVGHPASFFKMTPVISNKACSCTRSYNSMVALGTDPMTRCPNDGCGKLLWIDTLAQCSFRNGVRKPDHFKCAEAMSYWNETCLPQVSILVQPNKPTPEIMYCEDIKMYLFVPRATVRFFSPSSVA